MLRLTVGRSVSQYVLVPSLLWNLRPDIIFCLKVAVASVGRLLLQEVTFALEVEVKLRPTVSRPVCLGVRHPSGTRDQFFFSLKFSLDSCMFVIL
jgi:hypothetical protein